MSFEEREHTADILMHVRAPDVRSLFTECGHALMSVMYTGTARADLPFSLSVTGSNPEQMLQAFLSELLCLTEIENVVFSDISVSISGDQLTARLLGEAFDRERNGGGTEVKGISFSGLSVRQENGEYVLDVLFDV